MVQHRFRVAHATGRLTGHQAERFGVGGASIGLEDHGQLALDLGHGQSPEVEALDARQDGRPDLRRIGRAEDEDNVVRRFLQGLEQDVPALVDPLDLVDDEDLAAQVRGCSPGPLHELPDLVHLVVGRRVHLNDIERTALADGNARVARVACIAVLQVRAVERLGHDPREGRLAGPARPNEEERMGDLAAPDRVAQGRDHGLLADDAAEGLRPPAPVERPVRCPGRRLSDRLLGTRAAHDPTRCVICRAPSVDRTFPRPPSRAARARPFRGTRRRSLSAASFRT